jgi:hypothetical protein
VWDVLAGLVSEYTLAPGGAACSNQLLAARYWTVYKILRQRKLYGSDYGTTYSHQPFQGRVQHPPPVSRKYGYKFRGDPFVSVLGAWRYTEGVMLWSHTHSRLLLVILERERKGTTNSTNCAPATGMECDGWWSVLVAGCWSMGDGRWTMGDWVIVRLPVVLRNVINCSVACCHI